MTILKSRVSPRVTTALDGARMTGGRLLLGAVSTRSGVTFVSPFMTTGTPLRWTRSTRPHGARLNRDALIRRIQRHVAQSESAVAVGECLLPAHAHECQPHRRRAVAVHDAPRHGSRLARD